MAALEAQKQRQHLRAFIEANYEPQPSPPVAGQYDRGISRAVKILQDNGVEIYESCEGGSGHSFPEPTVRFEGGPGDGWRAVGVCLSYGLPILCLRRLWHILDGNDVTGPSWEIVFRRRLTPDGYTRRIACARVNPSQVCDATS